MPSLTEVLGSIATSLKQSLTDSGVPAIAGAIRSETRLEFVRDTSVKFFWTAVICMGFFTLGYVLRVLFIKLEQKLSHAHHFRWSALCRALVNPIFFLCLFIGMFLALSILSSVQSQVNELVAPLWKISLAICLAWVCLIYIGLCEKKYRVTHEQLLAGLDTNTTDALLKLIKIFVFLVTILVIMNILEISIAGIMTVAGLGGLSIALAAKDTVSNFISTIILYLDKPFSIGHRVRLPSGKEGEIEYIGWRMTKLRTADKTSLYIPNASFLTMDVENYSKMTHRHLEQVIGIRFEDLDKFNAITKAIKAALMKTSGIDHREQVLVSLHDVTSSALQFKVEIWTKSIDRAEFFALRQQIVLSCLSIIAEHGAKVALPIYGIEMSGAAASEKKSEKS